MNALQRVLEPEVMDSEQEAVDYDAMDHSQVNQQFVADLIEADFGGGDVLDVGTGTAQIPIALCQARKDCRVMAIDMSVSMLDLACYNIEAAGLVESITLSHVDAKELPFDDASFDTVISNSIVHHLAEPTGCLQQLERVLRPGGLLFVRDLMRPQTDAQVIDLVQRYAGDENEHQQKMFDDSLRAALSLEEIRQCVETIGFPAETVNSTSDRHWTWVARKPE